MALRILNLTPGKEHGVQELQQVEKASGSLLFRSVGGLSSCSHCEKEEAVSSSSGEKTRGHESLVLSSCFLLSPGPNPALSLPGHSCPREHEAPGPVSPRGSWARQRPLSVACRHKVKLGTGRCPYGSCPAEIQSVKGTSGSLWLVLCEVQLPAQKYLNRQAQAWGNSSFKGKCGHIASYPLYWVPPLLVTLHTLRKSVRRHPSHPVIPTHPRVLDKIHLGCPHDQT